MFKLSRKSIRICLVVFAILALVIAIEYYFHRQKLYPYTEDAYVQSSFTKVSTLVSGKIAAIHVKNGQHITKGQLLFQLDDKPYLYALHAAEAKLDIANRKLFADKHQISAIKAEIQKASLEIALLKKDESYATSLAASKDGSQYNADLAITKLHLAEQNKQVLEEKLMGLEKVVGSDSNNPVIKAATAEYDKARFDVQHTKYHAPIAGIVENVHLHDGDTVAQGRPLFIIVNPENYWVEANYSEKLLRRIKVGQQADIYIDMYPGDIFHGVVESIDQASQASFSLLPAQNTTGNWVKVTQRFSVKIALTKPWTQHLRVGSSCAVRIDTKS